MYIIAVDSDKKALCEFEKRLHEVFTKETIKTFNNPLDALKYADQNTIDILFTDIRIKPIDGYELIKSIRQKQQCFAYVISGSKENPDDLSWMAVNGYYAKPVSVEELQEIKKLFDYTG